MLCHFFRVQPINYFKRTSKLLFRDKNRSKFCSYPVNHERGYSQNDFTSMIISDLSKACLKQILHPLILYDSEIMLFDYEYYQQACVALLSYQKKLSTGEILMIMRMGKTYKITNLIVSQHFQNQLYCRFNNIFRLELNNYDEKIKMILQNINKKIQSQSSDYFQILTEQQKEKQELQQSQRLNKTQKSQDKFAIKIMGKNQLKHSLHTEQLCEIAQLLVWYKSKNQQFSNLLLQILAIRLQNQIPSKHPLSYLKLLMFICNSMKQHYTMNKKNYTVRSIKNIARFQSYYLIEFIKHTEKILPNLSYEEIKQTIQLLISSPIKKNQLRKQIGIILIKELHRRGIKDELLAAYWQYNQGLANGSNKMMLQIDKIMGGGVINSKFLSNSGINNKKQAQQQSI